MGWTNIAIDILLFFFVIVSVLMCLVVLMQRSKQEGLGAAFGGGFTESVWGAQTSQVLVKATVWLAALFFILSISLARLYSHRAAMMEKPSMLQQELMKPGVPATTNAAPTATTPLAPVPASSTPTAPGSMTPAAVNPANPGAPDKPAGK